MVDAVGWQWGYHEMALKEQRVHTVEKFEDFENINYE
jgi:hypothetical protein